MMTAKMWLLLILISMAFLAGELGGAVLAGYLMAWRAKTANNKTHRPHRTYKENAGTDGAARDAGQKTETGACVSAGKQ